MGYVCKLLELLELLVFQPKGGFGVRHSDLLDLRHSLVQDEMAMSNGLAADCKRLSASLLWGSSFRLML